MSFSGLRGNALRIWGLAALVALAVFLVTRTVLLWHSVRFGAQSPAALIGPLVLGTLRDLPPAAVIASPWALFELLFSARWRARVRRPLFAIYVFTLLFVAVSEAVFWDEFSVRFNFIAVDYLIFTTEVIGNIRESYPVGEIVSALLVLTGFVVWALRHPLAAPAAGRQWVSEGLAEWVRLRHPVADDSHPAAQPGGCVTGSVPADADFQGLGDTTDAYRWSEAAIGQIMSRPDATAVVQRLWRDPAEPLPALTSCG